MPLKRPALHLAAFSASLALAGCEGEPDRDTRDDSELGGEAAGEVLGGTISDDMLPLEQLRSQSPPAEAGDDPDSVTDNASLEGPEPQDPPPSQPGPEQRAPQPAPRPTPSPSPGENALPIAPPVATGDE
jgi:hypothetical protein